MFDESKFTTKKELFDFLIKERSSLVAQKKAELKKADCISLAPTIVRSKDDANKANEPVDVSSLNELKVLVVINTTNLLDSHNDVHLPGIWKKSLSENKMIMHLQEHRMDFEKIISDGDKLKAFTKTYSWKELGVDFEGQTEALVFESIIERKRNPFMFEQYANGWVKNHSVGMRYVRLDFAINDPDYPNEFEAWEKYYPEIVNKDVADDRGYFWYVLEAKVAEGSAVPRGSNYVTPTLENNKRAPEESTHKEDKGQPSNDTDKRSFYLHLNQ